MSCISSVSMLSNSSCTIQYKLKQIWKKIQHSNPLLAGLIDVDNVTQTAMTIVKQIKVETEDIIKQLGTPISLRLSKKGSKFYVHLFTDEAMIGAEVRLSKDDEEAIDLIDDTEASILSDTPTETSDDLVGLERSSFSSEKWPRTVYSILKTSLENFCYTPRYSKEAFALHSASSNIESTLAIARGEVLSVKIYRSKGLGILSSFYHFGVYIGKMKTKDGVELEDAVIELGKNDETKKVGINAIPLVGHQKGMCFVLERTKSGHPPLLFKVKYGTQTEADKNKTADRALDFYNTSDYCLKKYSPFSNNCEHFVNICAFGNSYCEQHVRFVMTTVPAIFKGAPAVAEVLRYIFIAIAETAEVAWRSTNIILGFLGESVALGMLVIEYAFRVIWDIYLLKKSGCLTFGKVKHIILNRLASIAPELLVGIGFLLVAILCTLSGPIGVTIGITGTVIMLLLRFTVRPRIERWIQRREAARLEDFLQWHPHEVARLAMEASEDDDTNEDLLANFESRKLTGKTISELMYRDRMHPSENHLATTLQFLSQSRRLDIFKKNLNGILKHLDISEALKSNIDLTYDKWLVTIDTSGMSNITVSQLLDMASLNWKSNFKKGHWQLRTHEDGKDTVVASYAMDGSLKRKIEVIPESSTKVELLYEEASKCTLL